MKTHVASTDAGIFVFLHAERSWHEPGAHPCRSGAAVSLQRAEHAFGSVLDQARRLAGLGAGAIVVPVNPALTAAEVGYIIAHSAPALMFVDADLVEVVRSAAASSTLVVFDGDGTDGWAQLAAQGEPDGAFADCAPDDPAVIFYTSGTIGRPKGVLLAHRALLAITDVTCRNFRLKPGGSSLIPNSLSFIYPLMINCFSCIRSGHAW